MQNSKVAIYYLNAPSTWEIREALSQRGITEIKWLEFIADEAADPTVNIVVAIFDEYFVNLDTEHHTEDGKPDWREEVAFEVLNQEIQLLHGRFPSAKIILVDCVGMTVDGVDEYSCGGPDQAVFDLLKAQCAREKEVWRKLREKFFQIDYCATEEFSLASKGQEPVAQRIADLIAGS